MIDTSTKDLLGHLKRLSYACVGTGFIGLTVFHWTSHAGRLPVWRYIVGIAGGLFFIYVGLMYYLPKARRSRANLNALLEEAEAAERTAKNSSQSAK